MSEFLLTTLAGRVVLFVLAVVALWSIKLGGA